MSQTQDLYTTLEKIVNKYAFLSYHKKVRGFSYIFDEDDVLEFTILITEDTTACREEIRSQITDPNIKVRFVFAPAPVTYQFPF